MRVRRPLHEAQYVGLAKKVEQAFDERFAARSDELAELAANRRRLEDESDKLLATHFADAIDLTTLKRHQDRIRAGLADIDRRIENEHDQDQGPRRQIAKALRLLIDCQRLSKSADAHGKRLANQTFTTSIDINEDEEATIRLVEPFAVTTGESTHVRCLSMSETVDAMERCGNRRPRVERLVSAWSQGIREDADSAGEPDDPLIEASAEPRRRARTRLTDNEVDAMRTARANGVSVTSLAKQFGIHRATVWAKTRGLVVRSVAPLRTLDVCGRDARIRPDPGAQLGVDPAAKG